MHYFVYILYSKDFDKYYKGQCNDIENRLLRHNQGEVKSTAPYKPWILVWSALKDTRSEAMRLERKLKNLSKLKTKLFIEKYSN